MGALVIDPTLGTGPRIAVDAELAEHGQRPANPLGARTRGISLRSLFQHGAHPD